jgi:hypothetical protein
MPTKTKTKAETKVSRYLVVAENEGYEGKTFGIRFNQGRAVVDSNIVPKHLHRSAEEIAAGFRDLPGYTVTEVE